MRSIDEIISEIAKADEAWHKEVVAQLPAQCLGEWATDLRESYNALITEALDVIGDLTSSATCMHCDLHDACAEGEDGMPTACNQFLKARQFCEKYKREKDTNGECPF